MLKTELQVEIVGEPSIETLTDIEGRSIFEIMFSKIVELYKASREQQD
ncbi:MAG: hypothetical protein SO434_03350 [Eubacteriales bacterium]|nr:hypothetical protein [Eubacteriales bacterium]